MRWIGLAFLVGIATVGTEATPALLAQKPTFEVASVKHSNSKRTSVDTSPGNLTMTGVTVFDCVRWAFGSGGKTLPEYQVSGGPDWSRAEMYDITAKPATTVSERDQYRLMLQALLAERFKLIVHSEKKEVTVYILTLGKSDPKVAASTAQGNVRNIQFAPEGIIFRNALMSEVAGFLAGLPAFDRPVLDKTGLEGRLDFTIPMMLERPKTGDEGGLRRAVNALDYSNYSFGLGEVGFKLESQREPIETFVIDDVQRPTEN